MEQPKPTNPLFEELKKQPKYKLGKRKVEQKAHNANGKIAFTTTIFPDNYEWLKEESARTGKSGSAILNSLIEERKNKTSDE